MALLEHMLERHQLCCVPFLMCIILRCYSTLGNTTPTTHHHREHQKHKPVDLLTGPLAVPLDLNTFCSIHVVAFSVRSIILGIGCRSRLKVLCVLCEFHSFGLGPWLVTELYQGHRHGKAETSDKNIENPSNIAQAQSACLVLRKTNQLVSFAVGRKETDGQHLSRGV